MNMKRMRLFIPFVVFVVVSCFLYGALSRDPNQLPSVLIDKTIPPFALPDLHDMSQQLTPEDLKTGKPYLLNIWATWCVSCKQEHPYLIKLAKSGIPIYGINWKDDASLALKELERAGNPYTKNIFDKKGALVLALGVTAAPETFIVDAEGVIRYKRVGVVNETVWTKEMSSYFQ